MLIERVYAGDGNDVVFGNELANPIWAAAGTMSSPAAAGMIASSSASIPATTRSAISAAATRSC